MTNMNGGRLLEVMPSRAIDMRPRLARAVDALAAACETKCANLFLEINRRVDAWESHGFAGRVGTAARSLRRR
jgi:hypothetical protein